MKKALLIAGIAIILGTESTPNAKPASQAND